MAIFSLLWALLVSFLFSPSVTRPTPETFNLINNTTLKAKAGCSSTCGDLVVPYPFGIGLNSNCSIHPAFDVYCDTSAKPPKAFFAESDRRISIKRISDSTVRTSNDVATRCYKEDGDLALSYSIHANYTNSQYTFSELNRFTVMGCDDHAWLHSKTKSSNVSAGCTVFCGREEDVLAYQCSGNGCCQSSIPQDMSYHRIRFNSIFYKDSSYKRTNSFNPCTHAFVGEKSAFGFYGAKDLKDTSVRQNIIDNVPIVFDWAIGNQSCPEAKKSKGYACQNYTVCVNSTRETGGYRCVCEEGYEGSPYLSPGCKDIDECSQENSCYGDCINIPGSYKCICKPGYTGNPYREDGCVRLRKISKFWVAMFAIGVVVGIAFLIFAWWLIKFMKNQKDKRRKEHFFERNGGLLLQQQLSKSGVKVDHRDPKFFTAIELEKATNQFSKDRVIGRGGQGIVYKGMLRDGRIVAVKKSNLMDEDQVAPFINEVFLLLQIDHQNVVRLLGCCLETEVPILVYEYITNGTLDDFIHNENYEFPPVWKIRMQIGIETAGVVAHLHSLSSPIYHRDIKSSNILLDEKFKAKISDFGISKSVPKDETHISTLAKGTEGYIDPEYHQTNRLTDKSDVYSFGIVLLELLTGKRPIFRTSTGERIGLGGFILSLKDEQVLENVDVRVSDAPKEQVMALANLAKRCLNLSGISRPNMEEVRRELERIGKIRN